MDISFFEQILMAAGDQYYIDYPYCICDRLNKTVDGDRRFTSVKTELESNSINVHAIDKKALVKIWESESSSVTKILVTLLWGGITSSNLTSFLREKDLVDKCERIIKSMDSILQASNTEKFLTCLKDSFRELANKGKEENCHINGVNEAFFTKFYHFFFEANKEKNKVGIHPIISDRWIRLAVCADMISKNIPFNSIFKVKDEDDVFFEHRTSTRANDYVEMVKYYNNRVQELKHRYPTLTAFSLESLLFGQHPINSVCPRCLAKDIIRLNSKLI